MHTACEAATRNEVHGKHFPQMNKFHLMELRKILANVEINFTANSTLFCVYLETKCVELKNNFYRIYSADVILSVIKFEALIFFGRLRYFSLL